ncbi:hypothetical protein EHQ68_12600 [Leptospira congkakensis]|uniref:Guanylate cyclase domain-containing protein n=1 Tax=Leptospira congkakensis TaxID=2484932 RepID=A0A4Z1AKM6_9LEPT|nr:hypothetical protein EHQ68_12600 [Leptospira congkakensis]TGL96978.1 hypothetical protein EHQ69_01545 [Leptospira congkakensis]TGL97829.1 hypothetical protein EHQ70_07200 [Leptospira congkakensis]
MTPSENPPPIIAERLKSKDKVKADKTNEATILFAHIVEFTVVSQTIEPEKIVSLLNYTFSEFDTTI